MLARLKNMIAPSGAPSVLLVIGKFDATNHILHLMPEDGAIERLSFTASSSTTPFRRDGATGQAREQISAVTLHVRDGDSAASFLDDVETRVRKLWKDSLSSSSGSVETTQPVQDVLQQAVLDAIRETEGRDRSMNATQMYPIFAVHIVRSRAGRILTELTSFPH